MFKRGDIVIKVIVGGGCKTASIQRVDKVSKKGVVTLVGQETLSWRNENGMEIEPAIRGFYSELIPLDGDEENKILGDLVPSR